MTNTFHLLISTPQDIFIDDEVYQVTMPTELGQTGILPNHANIIGIIVPGKIKIIYPNNQNEICLINHGVYTFENNRLTILSDFIQKSGTKIDEESFLKVKKEIEESIKHTDLSDNLKKGIATYIKKVAAQVKKYKTKR